MGETSETRYKPRACCQHGHAQQRDNSICRAIMRVSTPSQTRRRAMVLSYFALVFPLVGIKADTRPLADRGPIIIICSIRYDICSLSSGTPFSFPSFRRCSSVESLLSFPSPFASNPSDLLLYNEWSYGRSGWIGASFVNRVSF